MIKHATASVFVFCELEQGWRLGLIEHPRLGKSMVVGGHVEDNESQAEAAVRETLEESGLEVRLLAYPSPMLPVGYPHERVFAPWWITEVRVPADNHLAEPHVHVDHQYVAIADSSVPVRRPAHPIRLVLGERDRSGADVRGHAVAGADAVPADRRSGFGCRSRRCGDGAGVVGGGILSW